MRLFRRRRPSQIEPVTPAEASEWRLIQLQDRVLQADRLIRAYLETPSGPVSDVLLEVMVALGTAPAADDVPVVPGRAEASINNYQENPW